MALVASIGVCRSESALAITYDSATTEYFESIDDFGQATATDSIGLRFGTIGESVLFDRSTGQFVLSDDLDVAGAISGSSLSTGSVGIGTPSPTQRFHLKNGGTGEKFRIETRQSAYSIYQGGDFNGLADEAAITFGATLATHAADTSSTAWAIQASGANDYFSIDRGANNGQGNAATFTQLLRIGGDGNVGIGTGSGDAETKLEVAGVISGATLYAKSFSGAGLTDCDDATNGKLLWDATTGRFSCGTDQSGGSSGGGISQSDADARYVRTAGDTMTGMLLLQNTSIQASSGTFLGLDSNDDVVLTVKGGSMNMTDLQQWKDSSDTLLVNIGADGNLTAGNATFNGNLTANGSNITLGSDTSDNVSFGADVNTDINPEYGGMQGLGNSGARWNGWFYDVDVSNNLNVGSSVSAGSDIYAGGNLSGGNVTVRNVASCNSGYHLATDMSGGVYCEADSGGSSSSSSSGYFNISDGMYYESVNDYDTISFVGDGNINVNVSATDTVSFSLNMSAFSSSSSGYFGVSDGFTTEYIYDYDNITFSGGSNMNVTVSATDTVSIGTTDNVSFTDMTVNGNTTLGSSASYNVAFGALIASHFLPSGNVTYDLGNTSARWNTGYFGSLDVDGNVGIGTSSPSEKLHIKGDDGGIRIEDGSSTEHYTIHRRDSTGYLEFTGSQNNFSGYRWFIDDTTEAMTVRAVSGNVGIGVAAPASKLHVYGSSPAATVEDSAGNGATVQLKTTDRTWNLSNDSSGNFQLYDVSQSQTRFLVDSAGNTGVGTSSPDYKLDVNGAMIAAPPSTQTIASNGTITADACGTVKMINASSNITTNTTNTFTAPSAANAGCVMHVINAGPTWIVTLDANTNFKTPSGVNVTLSPLYAVTVVSSGSAWYVMASPSSNF